MGDRLLGEWKFNEPSGNAIDSSGNGTNATPSGGVTRSTGVEGNAITLDGTGYMTVAGDGFDNQPAMTWSVWYKQTSSVGVANLLEKSIGLSSWRIMCTNGQPSIAVSTTNNSWYSAGTALSVSAGSMNVWHQAVFVYDGTYITGYLDGAQIAKTSDPISGNIIRNAGQSMGIGETDGGGSITNFTGSIDDVRIYAGSLTAEAVGRLYAEGAPRHGLAVR